MLLNDKAPDFALPNEQGETGFTQGLSRKAPGLILLS
jgi:hypothetical protein